MIALAWDLVQMCVSYAQCVRVEISGLKEKQAWAIGKGFELYDVIYNIYTTKALKI